VPKKDYYSILGVEPGANQNQIKEAYRYKVNLLHPDRLGALPEQIRERAETELKEVNGAYAVLSSPEKRQRYDSERFGYVGGTQDLRKSAQAGNRKTKETWPKIEITPSVVRFRRAPPFVRQQAAFTVAKNGGPHNPHDRVLVGETPEWLNIIKMEPLQKKFWSRLPMLIVLEAVGTKWNTLYSAIIPIRVDGIETELPVEFQTEKEPSEQ
jgi:curved DNA-binding protein CbpA